MQLYDFQRQITFLQHLHIVKLAFNQIFSPYNTVCL
jgi:hypothetical protein